MRFLPDGLNIPDELLEECDKGNVVFLCGAGVSYPRGHAHFSRIGEVCGWRVGHARRRPDVLFSGKTFAEGLLALSDRAFWDAQHHRELLHLLRLRWRDVPPSKRRRLERRFAGGPPKYASESEEAYERRRSIHAATNLGWLKTNGCQFSNTTLNALRHLRRVNPDWRAEWDEAADESYDAIGGIVLTESDPAPIIAAPLDKVAPLAVQHTGHSLSELKEHRPFDGLVKQRPRKAVAALTHEARKGNYPTPFWDATLQEWPEDTPLRLVWVFCERLARLPSNIVAEIQSTLFRWLERHFPKLAGQDRNRSLRILDTLLRQALRKRACSYEELDRRSLCRRTAATPITPDIGPRD